MTVEKISFYRPNLMNPSATKIGTMNPSAGKMGLFYRPDLVNSSAEKMGTMNPSAEKMGTMNPSTEKMGSFYRPDLVNSSAEKMGSFYRPDLVNSSAEKMGTMNPSAEKMSTIRNWFKAKYTGFLTTLSEASQKKAICKKYGASVTLAVLFIICLTLVTLALTRENAKAGLFTLQINLNTLLNKALGHRTAERDIFPTIPNIASAVTAIPGLATVAVGAIESAIPDVIEAVLPRNISIGTTKFCIGRSRDTICEDLPLSFAGGLALGLGLTFVTSTISLAIIFDWFSLLPKGMKQGMLRDGVHVFSIVFCCVPFVLASVIAYDLKSKVQHLPSWIPVNLGKAYGFCLGSLGCAVCIMGLSVFVRIVF